MGTATAAPPKPDEQTSSSEHEFDAIEQLSNKALKRENARCRRRLPTVTAFCIGVPSDNDKSNRSEPMTVDTVFDLASLTKPVAQQHQS